MWKIVIHRLVLKEDFKELAKPVQRLLLKFIYKKLSRDPESYGSPLTGDYKGYRKLRVGDYRVIYRIVKAEVMVIVIKVGVRRDDKVYKDLIYRLRKL